MPQNEEKTAQKGNLKQKGGMKKNIFLVTTIYIAIKKIREGGLYHFSLDFLITEERVL